MDWKPYVDAIFAKHPGERLIMQYVVMAALANYPGATVANYHVLSREVRQSIRGRLHKDISFLGGLTLMAAGEKCSCYVCEAGTEVCACGIPRDICLVHRYAGEPGEDSTVCGAVHTVAAVVDDYTCGCGNTKCNKKEKSCWKCGAPISNK